MVEGGNNARNEANTALVLEMAGQLQRLEEEGGQGLQRQAEPLELWARLEILHKSDCRKVK